MRIAYFTEVGDAFSIGRPLDGDELGLRGLRGEQRPLVGAVRQDGPVGVARTLRGAGGLARPAG